MNELAHVLLMGDPRLRVRSREIGQCDDLELQAALAPLAATLKAFRDRYGFGRAISAPQIGVPLRLIAANLGKGTFFIVNPVITWKSEETFTMWDDCMSFPDLLVRVRRHQSISLEYVDEEGRPQRWESMEQAPAELLQHEIDHLDGVLAVDRAIDRESLVVKAEFDANLERFRAMVDYVIG